VLEFIEGSAGGADIGIRVYAIGAPRYRIELVGTDYKALEEKLEELSKALAEKAKGLGLEFSMERLKE